MKGFQLIETISRHFHVLLVHMILIFFSRLLMGFICSDTITFAAYHCRETQESNYEYQGACRIISGMQLILYKL